MSDHTPGPWYSTTQPERENEPSVAHIQSASINEDNYVCAVEILDSECEANARLIAAAPDMLDILKSCIVFIANIDMDYGGDEGLYLYEQALHLTNYLASNGQPNQKE